MPLPSAHDEVLILVRESLILIHEAQRFNDEVLYKCNASYKLRIQQKTTLILHPSLARHRGEYISVST